MKLLSRPVTALAVALFFVPSSLVANIFAFNFDTSFTSSDTQPASPTTPWVQALFEDLSPGTVRLSISAPNLTGDEFLRDLYLNLDPAFNPTALTFSLVSSSGAFSLPSSFTGVDAFKADGDGKYDILFEFSTSGGAGTRFTAGDVVVYDIGGIASLQAADFNFLSAPAGGLGPYHAAIHVQGLGPGGENSTYFHPDNGLELIPEPHTIALLVCGLAIGLAARRRR